MRLSCNKDDAGYGDYRRLIREGRTVHVYLDGVLVPDATIADEEQGIVERLRRNDAGDFVLTKDKLAVETDRLSGKVRLEIVG